MMYLVMAKSPVQNKEVVLPPPPLRIRIRCTVRGIEYRPGTGVIPSTPMPSGSGLLACESLSQPSLHLGHVEIKGTPASLVHTHAALENVSPLRPRTKDVHRIILHVVYVEGWGVSEALLKGLGGIQPVGFCSGQSDVCALSQSLCDWRWQLPVVYGVRL